MVYTTSSVEQLVVNVQTLFTICVSGSFVENPFLLLLSLFKCGNIAKKNQTNLDLRKEKWTFLNRKLTSKKGRYFFKFCGFFRKHQV